MNKKVKYTLTSGILSLVFSIGLIGCSNSQSQDSNKDDQSQKEVSVKENSSEVKKQIEGTFPSYTLEELNEKATVIVEGMPTKVIDSYEKEGSAFTKYSFKVTKLHKGDIDDNKEITLLQDGNKEHEFADHPLMELNKKYVLFLEKSPTGNLIMVGGPEGKYEYKENEKIFENIGHEKLNNHLEKAE
ncbi:hypothetical protein CEW92_03050 [Bacillaceae bacterium SAS-127]|nr:hypothetical protein CEW92_03050 [Bacillaceae bacterium SAS-127]